MFDVWLDATRPKTLPAAVAPVLVGSALAWRDGHFKPGAAAACLGFALLVQIGTNFANDYFDAHKGADTVERVGPTRAVASGLVTPKTMRAAMWAAFAAAFCVGLTLLTYGGWPLLAVGVASILFGVGYTGGPYPLAYHGLGDVFVFIFFGLVAVGATEFVQSGTLSWAAVISGTGVGALATNILVANNYRDVETDAKANKRTLLVRWGRDYGRMQFGLGHACAVATPLVLVLLGAAHVGPALIVAGIAAIVMWRQISRLRAIRAPRESMVLLGMTGRWLAGYGVLLAAAVAGPELI